jgi:hypothetical protein
MNLDLRFRFEEIWFAAERTRRTLRNSVFDPRDRLRRSVSTAAKTCHGRVPAHRQWVAAAVLECVSGGMRSRLGAQSTISASFSFQNSEGRGEIAAVIR